MSHSHSNTNILRIQAALLLTAVFTVVELAGGIISGSLALLADAGHMLTDTMALALAAVAFRVSNKPADRRRSYGYQRFQIIAAFVNGLCLLGIVGWILVEAVTRMLAPQEVEANTMLLVAGAGLLVNIFAYLILQGGDRNNLNTRAAALHVLGDLLGSLAAITAALVILGTGWLLIDPILSVLVALLVMRSAWFLVKRSSHILLEGAPEWLDVDDMQSTIVEQIPEVVGIHHVHVWGLTQEDLMLTMHVVLAEGTTEGPEIVRGIKKILRSDYGIRHSTVETEWSWCADD